MTLTASELKSERSAFENAILKIKGIKPLSWDGIAACKHMQVDDTLLGKYVIKHDQEAWEIWLACLEWRRVQ